MTSQLQSNREPEAPSPLRGFGSPRGFAPLWTRASDVVGVVVVMVMVVPLVMVMMRMRDARILAEHE